MEIYLKITDHKNETSCNFLDKVEILISSEKIVNSLLAVPLRTYCSVVLGGKPCCFDILSVLTDVKSSKCIPSSWLSWSAI